MTSELNIIECIQGSPEWLEARCGMLGASRIADAIRKAKRESTGELQTRANLKMELAVERVTGKLIDHYVSDWMERGLELEPLARAAYELRIGTDTEQVGFVLHPDRDALRWAGCSPDGLIGKDGMVQFKCPKNTTHAEYLIGECVPTEYRPQMLWEMACCPGRAWSDFVSYCPDFKPPLDLFICRLERDNARIAEMEAEAKKFLEEVEALVTRLRHGLEGALESSIDRVRNGKS